LFTVIDIEEVSTAHTQITFCYKWRVVSFTFSLILLIFLLTYLCWQKKTRSADRKRQVGRLLILVVVVFALLWLPIHLLLLFVNFYGDPEQVNLFAAVYVLCTGLAYFNSCVNPIIYNRTSKDFRDAFRSAVGCQKRVKLDDGDGGDVATPLRAGRAAAGGQRADPDDGKKPTAEDCEDGQIHVEN